MAEFNQVVPKHPQSCDKTLDEVLHDIVQRNMYDRKLVRYEIASDSVKLTYRIPD